MKKRNRGLSTYALVALLALPLYGACERMSRLRSSTAGPIPPIPSTAEGLPSGAQYLVEGSGAPRPDYGQCQRDLPAFEKLLSDRGLRLIDSVTCVQADDDPDSYLPAFQAVATVDLAVETAQGARFNTLSYCEAAADRMRAELERKSGKVLETACAPIQVGESAPDSEPLYQPVAIVIKLNDRHEPRIYSSIETLVDSVSETTRRDLAGSEDDAPVAAANAQN